MIWLAIKRIVDLLTLALLILLISIVMTNNKSSEDFGNFSLKLELFKEDYIKATNNNIAYIDNRINKLAEVQDRYQVSTDQRVYVIEQRLLQLQTDKKNNSKVINTNTNINTLLNN